MGLSNFMKKRVYNKMMKSARNHGFNSTKTMLRSALSGAIYTYENTGEKINTSTFARFLINGRRFWMISEEGGLYFKNNFTGVQIDEEEIATIIGVVIGIEYDNYVSPDSVFYLEAKEYAVQTALDYLDEKNHWKQLNT